MVARLTRLLPIFAVVIIAAVLAYFIISWLSSANRAKEVLIKAFLVLCSVFSGFFVLAMLYAVLEQNWVAVEFAFTFLVPGLVGLAITLICRSVFLRHNPEFAIGPVRATVINPKPWRKIVDAVLRLFGYTRTK